MEKMSWMRGENPSHPLNLHCFKPFTKTSVVIMISIISPLFCVSIRIKSIVLISMKNGYYVAEEDAVVYCFLLA